MLSSCNKLRRSYLKHHTDGNTDETRMGNGEHEWNTSEHEWEMDQPEWEMRKHEWKMKEYGKEKGMLFKIGQIWQYN